MKQYSIQCIIVIDYRSYQMQDGLIKIYKKIYIGLTSDQANICKTLSNYSAFTSTGWTTGY